VKEKVKRNQITQKYVWRSSEDLQDCRRMGGRARRLAKKGLDV